MGFSTLSFSQNTVTIHQRRPSCNKSKALMPRRNGAAPWVLREAYVLKTCAMWPN
jgi:hypothetical protein